MLWTDETVEHLRRLWLDGKSASQIAAELGGDATRNAVIGKFHRLGLTGRVRIKAPAAPRVRQNRAQAPRPRKTSRTNARAIRGYNAFALDWDSAIEPVPHEDVVIPMSLLVTLLELNEAMCRWPLGDPFTPEFRYCGLEAHAEGSYCRHHMRLAYRPRSEWRRKPTRMRPTLAWEAV